MSTVQVRLLAIVSIVPSTEHSVGNSYLLYNRVVYEAANQAR